MTRYTWLTTVCNSDSEGIHGQQGICWWQQYLKTTAKGIVSTFTGKITFGQSIMKSYTQQETWFTIWHFMERVKLDCPPAMTTFGVHETLATWFILPWQEITVYLRARKLNLNGNKLKWNGSLQTCWMLSNTLIWLLHYTTMRDQSEINSHSGNECHLTISTRGCDNLITWEKRLRARMD